MAIEILCKAFIRMVETGMALMQVMAIITAEELT